LFHGSRWLLLAQRYDSSILLPGPVRVHGSGLLELDAGLLEVCGERLHGVGLPEVKRLNDSGLLEPRVVRLPKERPSSTGAILEPVAAGFNLSRLPATSPGRLSGSRVLCDFVSPRPKTEFLQPEALRCRGSGGLMYPHKEGEQQLHRWQFCQRRLPVAKRGIVTDG